MQLRSMDGEIAYHFQVTPGGWNLCAMARDQFFEPTDSFTFEHLLAKKLKAERREHFRPYFSIDYVRGTVVNITWAAELITNSLAAATITRHLREVEGEYDLALLTLVGDLQCKDILNGFFGNHSIRIVLTRSGSELTNTSGPAKL